MTRLRFLECLASMALMPKATEAEESYSVVMLGDVHFDSADALCYHSEYHPDSDYLRRAKDSAQARAEKMWGPPNPLMPRLAAATRRDIRPDTKFVLQLGDIIQGNCGKEVFQRKMLTDAFDYFKSHAAGPLPFLTVVGNHDVSANVWTDETTVPPAIYRRVILPRVAHELGEPLDSTTFAFRQCGDLFLFADSIAPDFDRIRSLLESNRDARHVFLVAHYPVIPNNPVTGREGAYREVLLGAREQTDERRELLKLLCRRQAIALVGHSHRTELIEVQTPEGRLTQFMGSSVWAKPKSAVLPPRLTGKENYGVIPARHPRGYDLTDAAELFGEYRPLVTRYATSGLQGRYLLEVSGSSVRVSIRGGDSPDVLRHYELRS